jgi:hypothetical protein
MPAFGSILLSVLAGCAVVAEQVAWLAAEDLADPGQGAEPDRPGVICR